MCVILCLNVWLLSCVHVCMCVCVYVYVCECPYLYERMRGAYICKVVCLSFDDAEYTKILCCKYTRIVLFFTISAKVQATSS